MEPGNTIQIEKSEYMTYQQQGFEILVSYDTCKKKGKRESTWDMNNITIDTLLNNKITPREER